MPDYEQQSRVDALELGSVLHARTVTTREAGRIEAMRRLTPAVMWGPDLCRPYVIAEPLHDEAGRSSGPVVSERGAAGSVRSRATWAEVMTDYVSTYGR